MPRFFSDNAQRRIADTVLVVEHATKGSTPRNGRGGLRLPVVMSASIAADAQILPRSYGTCTPATINVGSQWSEHAPPTIVDENGSGTTPSNKVKVYNPSHSHIIWKGAEVVFAFAPIDSDDTRVVATWSSSCTTVLGKTTQAVQETDAHFTIAGLQPIDGTFSVKDGPPTTITVVNVFEWSIEAGVWIMAKHKHQVLGTAYHWVAVNAGCHTASLF